MENAVIASTSSTAINLTPTQLHHYLGHIYPPATIPLIKEKLIDGIELANGDEVSFCKACVKSKHTCENFLKE
jgi:hypothetical protein